MLIIECSAAVHRERSCTVVARSHDTVSIWWASEDFQYPQRSTAGPRHWCYGRRSRGFGTCQHRARCDSGILFGVVSCSVQVFK